MLFRSQPPPSQLARQQCLHCYYSGDPHRQVCCGTHCSEMCPFPFGPPTSTALTAGELPLVATRTSWPSPTPPPPALPPPLPTTSYWPSQVAGSRSAAPPPPLFGVPDFDPSLPYAAVRGPPTRASNSTVEPFDGVFTCFELEDSDQCLFGNSGSCLSTSGSLEIGRAHV